MDTTKGTKDFVNPRHRAFSEGAYVVEVEASAAMQRMVDDKWQESDIASRMKPEQVASLRLAAEAQLDAHLAGINAELDHFDAFIAEQLENMGPDEFHDHVIGAIEQATSGTELTNAQLLSPTARRVHAAMFRALIDVVVSLLDKDNPEVDAELRASFRHSIETSLLGLLKAARAVRKTRIVMPGEHPKTETNQATAGGTLQ